MICLDLSPFVELECFLIIDFHILESLATLSSVASVLNDNFMLCVAIWPHGFMLSSGEVREKAVPHWAICSKGRIGNDVHNVKYFVFL